MASGNAPRRREVRFGRDVDCEPTRVQRPPQSHRCNLLGVGVLQARQEDNWVMYFGRSLDGDCGLTWLGLSLPPPLARGSGTAMRGIRGKVNLLTCQIHPNCTGTQVLE
ncbi:hypothetical protein PDE_06836 [Penicillium oxalicum 114-2]|uniref:Uncharacterized protein n=1 Tax=Penicillium oxalicum (strain 114-2 / CGMCC 5302) TaxID=933388 RepID=S8AZL0_PENO1|nr:hypothetical protein PDE_06836 [Penicillium oxalicum 114-2]